MSSIQPNFDFKGVDQNTDLKPTDKREVIVKFKEGNVDKAYKITIEGAKNYSELATLAHEAFALAIAYNVGQGKTKQLEITKNSQGLNIDRKREGGATKPVKEQGKDAAEILENRITRFESPAVSPTNIPMNEAKRSAKLELAKTAQEAFQKIPRPIQNPPKPILQTPPPAPSNPSSQQVAPTAPPYQAAIKQVRKYAPLTPSQKSEITVPPQNNNSSKILEMKFAKHSQFNVTIRNEGLFDSRAQVIVNAANTHLGGGSGIDGEIHRAGGPAYAAGHAGLKTHYKGTYTEGFASMIGSGDLKENRNIDHVIVIAGPNIEGGTVKDKDRDALYSCYYNSLVLAHEQGKKSIAFPSISTGIFAFPKDEAAKIATKAIYDFLEKYPNSLLKTISIHFQDQSGFAGYEQALN